MRNKFLKIALPLAVIAGVTVITIARNPPDYEDIETPSSLVLPEREIGDDDQSNLSAKVTPKFEIEMEAFIPKSVPGHELAWLNGKWERQTKMTRCRAKTSPELILFSATHEGLHVVTGVDPYSGPYISPEFGDNSGPKLDKRPKPKQIIVHGIAQVNLGGNGYIYVTPPDWEQAYYHIKSVGDGELEAKLAIFNPAKTAWDISDPFRLIKCR